MHHSHLFTISENCLIKVHTCLKKAEKREAHLIAELIDPLKVKCHVSSSGSGSVMLIKGQKVKTHEQTRSGERSTQILQ